MTSAAMTETVSVVIGTYILVWSLLGKNVWKSTRVYIPHHSKLCEVLHSPNGTTSDTSDNYREKNINIIEEVPARSITSRDGTLPHDYYIEHWIRLEHWNTTCLTSNISSVDKGIRKHWAGYAFVNMLFFRSRCHTESSPLSSAYLMRREVFQRSRVTVLP